MKIYHIVLLLLPLVTLAERPIDAVIDGAFADCFERCWSPRTSLLYGCGVAHVKKAATFKDGLYDWYQGSKEGYGAGMGDCAISDGVALSGCVDRWAALTHEGVPADDPRLAQTADWAAKLAQGLLNLSSKHGYTGFVARGLCEEDGKSICSLSSIDQHTHWVHALYRYSHSPMAKPAIVAEWKVRVAEVAARMERTVKPETDYNFGLCDGRPDPRGICRMWWPEMTNATGSCRLPAIYAAAFDATGNPHWKELYEKLADKAARDSACLEQIKQADPKWKYRAPTYTLLQMNVALEVLIGCEKDPKRRVGLLEGLRQSAAEADFRAKDMWANPKKKWYGMAPDAELALAQLTANHVPYDETELAIFEKAVREGDAKKWWSLKTTHMFAAYWRARLRGLFRVDEQRVQPVDGDATAAIQSAIDTVWQQGGGRVSLAPGVYAVKGLRLRSNVELHLERKAILNASRDCGDYVVLNDDPREPVPESLRQLSWRKGWSGRPLEPWYNGIIRIFCASNVAITGEAGSAIDGHNSYSPTGEEKYRGVHGICADFSTNVVVRGVELRNTGNWATRFYDSANLRFEDLRIRGGHDGVHVRSCDRVCVSNCDIRSGDDCIAGFDNNDVLVMDCALNTGCSAFRFGGTHVRVSRCHVWGPAEWPFRGTLSAADKAAGVSSQGRGRANLLSFWTYFADFSRGIRNPPGDIVVTDCTVDDADRLLHYNFSGNEIWQKGAPLGDIRFERVTATNIGMSLCAYGEAKQPLTLSLNDCAVSFRTPQPEFIRAAHLGNLTLEKVQVKGVKGPCIRSWGGETKIKSVETSGIDQSVKPADKPFSTPCI